MLCSGPPPQGAHLRWKATATARHDDPVSFDPHDPKPAPQVRIIHLTGPVFDALAAGDAAAAGAVSPVPLTAYFAGADWRSVWKMRSDQVRDDPSSAAWVTGVIWDEQREVAVGRAGYHGPPD